MKNFLKPLKKNQGISLLGSLVASIFLGAFIMLSFMKSFSHLQFDRVSRRSQDALYAAEKGLQKTLQQIRNDIQYLQESGNTATNWIDIFDSNNALAGQYRVAYQDIRTPQPGVADRSTYIYYTVEGQDAQQRSLIVLDIIVRTIPPTAFFISTLSDLNIVPGAQFDHPQFDIDLFAKKFNFHNATADQQIKVDGNIHYLTEVLGFDHLNPSNTPYINVTGEVIPAQPTTFIGVDVAYYQSLAGYEHTGDLIVSGNIDRNTEFGSPGNNGIAENGIVYASGDIYINGIVDASMVFVAAGNIYINGDLMYNPSSQENLQLGLFAKGDILIQNLAAQQDRTVQALLISEGRLLAPGNNNDYGTLNFFGAMSIRGDFQSESSIVLSSFSQRNYQWHHELFNDSTIPAMSFMADIYQWSMRGQPSKFIQ